MNLRGVPAKNPILRLSVLPAESVAGIYDIDGVSERLPARMLFLEPAAAAAFLAEPSRNLVCSDMFRSPESSLAAVRSG